MTETEVEDFTVTAPAIAEACGIRTETVHMWKFRDRRPEPDATPLGSRDPAWWWHKTMRPWLAETGRLLDDDDLPEWAR